MTATTTRGRTTPRPFVELTPRGQALRVRQLALNALPAYDVAVRRVTLLSNDLNGIFRVDLTNGERRMLRVSEPTWRSDSDLHAELAWLQSLAATAPDIGAPVPYPNRDGQLVTLATAPGVPEARRCVLFSWVPGRPAADALTQANVQAMGSLSARLHAQAATVTFPPDVQLRRYDRILPRGERYLRDLPEYAAVLPPERKRSIDAAVERANAGFATLLADSAALRPIHGDLHHSNVLIHRGVPRPVDFEDIIIGHPTQDIALTFYDFLYYTDPKQHDYATLCGWFQEGYTQHSPWPATPELITAMQLARRVWTVDWVLHDEPPTIHDLAMRRITAYIDTLLAR